MAITKADILTFVNAKLNRTETDIDTEIQTILDDLSDAELLVGTDTDQSMEDSDEYLEYPTNYKRLISIVLNDGSTDGAPLEALPGGWDEYLEWMKGAVSTGEPEWFVEHNSRFYVWRPANGDYTASIEFFKKHPEDLDSILFGDDFTDVINAGSTYKAALRYGLSRYINIWGPEYARLLQERIDNAPYYPVIVR